MEADIIKEVLPYIGGFGGAVVLLAILFKDGINVWLRKDSGLKFMIQDHERRLTNMEKDIHTLPAIQATLDVLKDEIKGIRGTLDRFFMKE